MRPKTPRAICLAILNRVGGLDAHADDLLSDSFKRYRHLTSLDRAFLTELTYGVLRWREKLDWAIRHFSNIPFEKIEPEIVNLLRLGLYQILFLTRTPTSAAVNESVELAKKFRGKGEPVLSMPFSVPFSGRGRKSLLLISIRTRPSIFLSSIPIPSGWCRGGSKR